MKILDYEGLKQVVSKIKSLMDKKADRSDVDKLGNSMKFTDTSYKDEPPSWYIKTHPGEVVKELKKTVSIGVDWIMSGEDCYLITMFGLENTNDSFPVQICISSTESRICYRAGRNNDLWSTWRRLLDKKDLKLDLSQLTDDAEHRTVSDEEKSKWNNISKVESQIKQIENEINSININIQTNIISRIKRLENDLYEELAGLSLIHI